MNTNAHIHPNHPLARVIADQASGRDTSPRDRARRGLRDRVRCGDRPPDGYRGRPMLADSMARRPLGSL